MSGPLLVNRELAGLKGHFYCARLIDISQGGVVTSTWIGAARGLEVPQISGRGGGSPSPERFVSQVAKRAAGCEMTLDVELVVNGGMKGQEALG